MFKDSEGEDVFFDLNGDSPALYDVLNWQVSPNATTTKYVQVGQYDSRVHSGHDLYINDSLIVWNNDNNQIPHSVCSEPCSVGMRKATRRGEPICCYDCIICSKGEISNVTDASNCFNCPEDQWPNEKQNVCIPKSVDFLSYEEVLGFVLTVFVVCFSLITAFILCIFIKYRDTPIVKANNRELSYLILTSLFLCFLCPLIFIGQPKMIACLLQQIGFGIIFSLCVSGILAKTITVVIAFKATKPDSNLRNYVGPRTPYYIVIVSLVVQVCICIVWLAKYPSFPDQNTKIEEGKIILVCNEGSKILFYCMLGYLGLLACVSFVVAFLARTLPDSFNEAKFISFSMIMFLSVWLSFIPAYLSTTGKYMIAVEIFAIIASGTGIIICIFLPKCYIILLKPHLNTRERLIGNKSSTKKI
ncbi:vomeronasal type-2 receptor 26-like [Protopterus annectens]|uniref:vomeronasal type-2 receptor 26-like n=1 Tax=Protopterus annectens TaxID=7888 RepID=UPI001CF9AFBD|nr:vomeronasal type-2 receptor 26-like [Protopterus annectens]